MLDQPHFGHADDNATYLRPEDFPRVDALLDRLIEKNQAGYKMVNSVQHFNDMKAFMRGHVDRWACRAGQNALIIRTDGTLAPCFTMTRPRRTGARWATRVSTRSSSTR